MARAAGAVADIFDPVVDDDRAVIAVHGAPDLDAVVARAIDPVARNQEARGVEDMNCSIGNVCERCAAHLAAGRDADEPAAARILDLAVGDADGRTGFELHQTATVWQRTATAVECETRQSDMIRCRCANERPPLREQQARCAARTHEVSAGGQFEITRAVDAGR